MKAIVWGLFVVLLVAFQSTLVPLLAIGGIKPDILLVITVSAGLLCGKETGVGIGFCGGMLQDLLSGNVFGLNTITKMSVGYLAGLAERKVFKENILLPVAAMMAASFLNGLMIHIIVYLRGYAVDWSGAFVHIVLPAMMYNMVAAIPLHLIFSAFYRRVRGYFDV